MVQLRIDKTDPLFPSLTKEMVDFFISEKNQHMKKVNEYAAKVGYIFPFHDADKFEDSSSCIWIIWSWCREVGYDLPAELSDIQKRATEVHQTSSPHHLLYWSDLTYKSFDSAEKITTYIPYMSKRGIVEMCCDFCASSENQGNPYDQVLKEIAKGYTLSSEVISQIVKLLDVLWDGDIPAESRQQLINMS